MSSCIRIYAIRRVARLFHKCVRRLIHISMSHGTYEWAMSHMNESRHMILIAVITINSGLVPWIRVYALKSYILHLRLSVVCDDVYVVFIG